MVTPKLREYLVRLQNIEPGEVIIPINMAHEDDLEETIVKIRAAADFLYAKLRASLTIPGQTLPLDVFADYLTRLKDYQASLRGLKMLRDTECARMILARQRPRVPRVIRARRGSLRHRRRQNWRRGHRQARGDPDPAPLKRLRPAGSGRSTAGRQCLFSDACWKTRSKTSSAQEFFPPRFFGGADVRPKLEAADIRFGHQVARLIELAAARGVAELLLELGRERMLGQIIENKVAGYVDRLEALGPEVLAALGADKLPPTPIHPININRGDDDQ
jgi:hypothetical protein